MAEWSRLRCAPLRAACGVVVLCGAVGCASLPATTPADNGGTTPSPSSSATPVAIVRWVDRPVALPPTPAPPSPTPQLLYQACTAKQLTVTRVESDGAMGHLGYWITLTNSSSTSCTLSGYPTSFTGVRADATTHALHAQHGSYFGDLASWPANLRPGHSGVVIFDTSVNCDLLNRPTPGPGDPYTGVILGMPGGMVSAPVRFDAACGVSVSTLGTAPPQAPDATSTNPYPGLTASADIPKTATAGSTMDFTVTLVNDAGHAVSLNPCPVYEIWSYSPGDGGPSSASYTLNCDAIKAVPAHGQVTYAMRASIPDTPGVAKFGWSIPAAFPLFVGTLLTITP